MNIQIFPLVGGNSSSTRPACKREYLYIHEYNFTIKLTYWVGMVTLRSASRYVTSA